MELPKRFNNVENKEIKVEGKPVYIHRAIAVVGMIFAHTDEGTKVLITKRSKNMRDNAGDLCVPCGYLDWTETLYEGMMREVYEETSLYMPDYKKYLVYNNKKQPFYIKDKPTAHRQNVSHIYLNIYDFTKKGEHFPKDVELFSCKETEWVKWLPMDSFLDEYNVEFSWAFDHNQTIFKGWNFVNNFVV